MGNVVRNNRNNRVKRNVEKLWMEWDKRKGGVCGDANSPKENGVLLLGVMCVCSNLHGV